MKTQIGHPCRIPKVNCKPCRIQIKISNSNFFYVIGMSIWKTNKTSLCLYEVKNNKWRNKLAIPAEFQKWIVSLVFMKDKKSQCDFCGKSFNESRCLNKHIKKVHKKTKCHKCDFCDKSFYQTSLLKTHIKRAHSGLIEIQS